MRCRVLLAAVLGLAGCAGGPAGRVLTTDATATRPGLHDVTRPGEWGAFERRTFVDGEGGVLPFRVLYPEGYDRAAGRRYPLVLFLHGAGERGDDNERQLYHGWKQFTDTRARFPAIVVFPQCPTGESWATLALPRRDPATGVREEVAFPALAAEPSRMERRVMGLVAKLKVAERVDGGRVYVMGLSMGGMGTFALIGHYPAYFAAAIPICGGGDTGAVGRYAHTTALWIAHGGTDETVPPRWSREVFAALRAARADDVLYTELPGVGHESWNRMFDRADLLPWLFSHAKGAGGRATSRP